jgi:peptidylprolyl isomerase
MAQAQVGDLVKVHYTGRLADGTIFDTSMEREPLEFTLGEGELIPGFEQAVLGMATGESKTETILADQAYGPHHTERVIDVERHHLPPDLQPELGQQLQMTRPDGTTITVIVTTITETQVTLDANHPLAGQDLIFDIMLVPRHAENEGRFHQYISPHMPRDGQKIYPSNSL